MKIHHVQSYQFENSITKLVSKLSKLGLYAKLSIIGSLASYKKNEDINLPQMVLCVYSRRFHSKV